MLQTSRMLQKEQTDLYAIERKLVQMLPKVQEALNSLKVEELHLKSQSVHQTISSQVLPSNSHLDAIPPTQSVSNDQINKQEIDLELFVNKLEQFDVENDSD